MTTKVMDNDDFREVRRFNFFCRYAKHTLNDASMFSRSEATVVIAKQRNF